MTPLRVHAGCAVFKRDKIISTTNHGKTELHYSIYSRGYHGQTWALSNTVAGDFDRRPPFLYYQRVRFVPFVTINAWAKKVRITPNLNNTHS